MQCQCMLEHQMLASQEATTSQQTSTQLTFLFAQKKLSFQFALENSRFDEQMHLNSQLYSICWFSPSRNQFTWAHDWQNEVHYKTIILTGESTILIEIWSVRNWIQLTIILPHWMQFHQEKLTRSKIRMTKHDLIIKLITLMDEKSRNISIKLN
jgi:hypothetical protein